MVNMLIIGVRIKACLLPEDRGHLSLWTFNRFDSEDQTLDNAGRSVSEMHSGIAPDVSSVNRPGQDHIQESGSETEDGLIKET